MKNISALNEVINPEIQPGVINHDMITKSYRAEFKGEAGRLKDLEQIDYNKIVVIRMESKNILRIDHLWVLTNLTKLSLNFNKIEKIENIEMLTQLRELDLSFNYIEKIENLETLVNLKTVSLFNNLITRIENIDGLTNLTIFSIGNNNIDTINGMERFRFLKNLKVLTFEGNPIAKEINMRIYLAAILPNLLFYEYVFITEDDKEEGQNIYVRELRDISNNEEDEIAYRQKQAKELDDKVKLSNSFIEDLTDHKIFELIWNSNPNTKDLLKIGEIVENYQILINKVANDLYQFGLEKFQERKNDIELFEKCISAEQDRVTSAGRILIEIFLEEKEEVCKIARKIFIKIESLQNQGFEGSCIELQGPKEEIDKIAAEFFDESDKLWAELLKQEIHLYESMEAVIVKMNISMDQMVKTFIEELPTYFEKVKQTINDYSEVLLNSLAEYIEKNDGTEHSLLFKKHVENKKGLHKYVAELIHYQIQKLDDLEQNLINKITEWKLSFLEKIKSDELKRNRGKLLEITYFLDQIHETFFIISSEVREELLAQEGA